jgi:hypothetical protein
MVTGRKIRLVYLTAVAAVLLLLLYLTTQKILGHSSPCGAYPSEEPAQPFLSNQFGTAALCVGGLLVGAMASYLGRFPRLLHIPGLQGLVLGGTEDIPIARGLVQLGLFLLLLFGSGALLFESYAVYKEIWPVTFYVRCGNDASPVWAALFAGGLCLLLGNWLWHAAPPTGTPTSPPTGTSTSPPTGTST